MIDENMVERVARALCRQYELEDGMSAEAADRAAASEQYLNFLPMARVAIEAMNLDTIPIVDMKDLG